MARIFAALAIAAALLSGAPARAETMTAEQYAQKLKAYDAEAISAAQAYAKTFNVMGAFEKTAPMVAQSLAHQLKLKNPDITDDQTKLFVETFEHVALVDNADVIDHAMILALLDVLSKDELVALNQFYSSPTGQAIVQKFSALSEKLAAVRNLMKTDVVPRALEAAKAKLKASGVDVKM